MVVRSRLGSLLRMGWRMKRSGCLRARIFPRATEEQRLAKVALIRHSIEEASTSVSERSLLWQMKQLFLVPANLRALTTACAVMAVSQLGGFNTLMYYSARMNVRVEI